MLEITLPVDDDETDLSQLLEANTVVDPPNPRKSSINLINKLVTRHQLR